MPNLFIKLQGGDFRSPLVLHMDIIEQIRQWTESFLEEGFFLVDVDQKQGSKKIAVFIDGDNGVDIVACKNLSRQLSEKLDEMDYSEMPYYLEVSSPGIDRPLKFKRQYDKNVGRELEVRLNGNNTLTGKLENVTDSGITLLLKDKKSGYKKVVSKEISYSEIAESMVLISFK